MAHLKSSDELRLCVVTDEASILEEVRIKERAGGRLTHYSLGGIVDSSGRPSELLDDIVETAEHVDAVLVGWDIKQAPLVGILSSRVRPIRSL